MAAQFAVCDGEITVRPGLRGLVAKATNGRNRDLLHGLQVRPVAAVVERAGEAKGELAGVGVELVIGGVPYDGHKDMVLCAQPGGRLVAVGQTLRGDAS